MKKTKHALFLFFIMIVLLNCNKQSIDNQHANNNLKQLINEIGYAHNEGLRITSIKVFQNKIPLYSSMYDNGGLTSPRTIISPFVSSNELLIGVTEFVNEIPAFQDINYSDDQILIEKANNILLTQTGIANEWDKTKINNNLLLQSTLSYQNYDILEKFLEIFQSINNLPFSSSEEKYNIFKNKISLLKNQCDINDNVGYELVMGLMEIATYSYEYWKQQSIPALANTVESKPIIQNNYANLSKNESLRLYANSVPVAAPVQELPEHSLAQLDAFGYITSWIEALDEDKRKPGGVQPSGQWRRIGKGLRGAVYMSMTPLIAKRMEEPIDSPEDPIYPIVPSL